MKSALKYVPSLNNGRPAWSAEIAKDRHEDEYPGCGVNYGQRHSGSWVVSIELYGEAKRYSDEFDTEKKARAAAVRLINSLEVLWP